MISLLPISTHIWNLKYRRNTDDKSPEENIEQSWRRVASALSAVEASDSKDAYADDFFEAMRDFKLIPAGRILNTAGSDLDCTMVNTFVMADFDDTVEGVMAVAQDAAKTMCMGGGLGYDFSKIRPTGTALDEGDGTAAGPLAAMRVCDSMCALMAFSGRRGAMMATMRCDHPDIRAFVTAKADKACFTNFNLSVMVSDDFMAAVASDDDWALLWKGAVQDTLPARDLWNLISVLDISATEPQKRAKRQPRIMLAASA